MKNAKICEETTLLKEHVWDYMCVCIYVRIRLNIKFNLKWLEVWMEKFSQLSFVSNDKMEIFVEYNAEYAGCRMPFVWTWMYVLRLICSLFLYSLWIIFVKKRDFNGRMQRRIRKLNFSMTKVLFKRARMEILYGWTVPILDVKSIFYAIRL